MSGYSGSSQYYGSSGYYTDGKWIPIAPAEEYTEESESSYTKPKRRKNMNNGLAIYDPESLRRKDGTEKKIILENIEETETFFKIVGNMEDKDILKMKVQDVEKKKAEVGKTMTIGSMKNWVKSTYKPDPMVKQIGYWFKERTENINPDLFLPIIVGIVIATVLMLAVRVSGCKNGVCEQNNSQETVQEVIQGE